MKRKRDISKTRPWLQIISQNLQKLWKRLNTRSWNKRTPGKIALCWFALEMHQSHVVVSLHVLMHGISGGGKTVLMQILTSLSNASSIPPDASGVGKCILVGRQKCFTIEDAGWPFFRNKGYSDLIKYSYHRDFSTTTTGSKTDFWSAAFFIATNIKFPFQFESKENLIPMSRRFLEIKFVSKLKTPADTCGFENQKEICLAITSSIAEEFPHGKITVEGDREEVETAENALKKNNKIIETTNQLFCFSTQEHRCHHISQITDIVCSDKQLS